MRLDRLGLLEIATRIQLAINIVLNAGLRLLGCLLVVLPLSLLDFHDLPRSMGVMILGN